MEWLGEIELENIEPDFGFEDASNPEKALNGQLFLVMTNLQALQQIYRLFKKWERDPDSGFPDDLANLKKAFEHLKTIRFWGPEDRIRETGLLDDWKLRLEYVQGRVPFEAELWFRSNSDRRLQAEAELREIVEELDGEIVQQCVIPEIAYHAVLGTIPRKHIQQIADQLDHYKNIKLLHCEGIMHVRPAGQCAAPLPEPVSENGTERDSRDEIPTGDPIVALLDGLPLTGHKEIDGRLIIDDPDEYESNYQAHERVHGTEMASLICHGDLHMDEDAAKRPLYVRPVMQPQHLDGRFDKEAIPEDELPVDLIHRAVRRLYVSEGGEPPAGPSVCIINFSICSLDRPLSRSMSPLARLIDWLAWEFNILFLVSVGNHLGDLRLDIPRSEFRDQDERLRSEAIVRAIASDTRNRRLLSPAETINGLTVGAVHEDASTAANSPYTIDPFPTLPPKTLLPSAPIRMPGVYSAHGPGYRRAIKPELLFPGGRQFLSDMPGNSIDKATLKPNSTYGPPGLLVASPGTSGSLSYTHHSSGTSNATALATRSASFLYEAIEQLRFMNSGIPPPEFNTVLIKALLVHSAEWADAHRVYETVLSDSTSGGQFKEHVGHFLGYGAATVDKVMVCTDQRVTIIGFGELGDGNAHEFIFPLPPSLSARNEIKRLTITLAWLTPVSSMSRQYRDAHLWFSTKHKVLTARPQQEAHHLAAQRGTVQHKILESSEARAYRDGDNIHINVNCRADARDLVDSIRYGLAVTLETPESTGIPIYQEVRDRLAISVPVQGLISS